MSPPSWRWVDPRVLRILHGESLALHGGASGVRDEGLFDADMARPLQRASYGEPPPDLAAAYASGLVGNPPFIDGNKRATFLAVGLFLGLNGWRLTASQVEATLQVMALAAGYVGEEAFADWLRGKLGRR